MIRYALRRVAYHASLLAGVLATTFVLFQVVPSDPARVILGPNASEAEVSALREQLGLHAPLAERFASFLGSGLGLDFGRSYVDERLVWPEVRQRAAVSATLVGMSAFLTFGYLALCLHVGDVGRRVRAALELAAVALPTMFSGVVVALAAARWTGLPAFSGRLDSPSDLVALLLPAFVLGLFPMATLSRILDQETTRLRSAPFTIAARAVGYSWRRLRWTRFSRNAAVPVLATFGTLLPMLFSGAFVIEVLFSVPGTGSLIAKSVLARDLPMLQGVVVVNGLLVISVHLVLELLFPLLDPRMASAES